MKNSSLSSLLCSESLEVELDDRNSAPPSTLNFEKKWRHMFSISGSLLQSEMVLSDIFSDDFTRTYSANVEWNSISRLDEGCYLREDAGCDCTMQDFGESIALLLQRENRKEYRLNNAYVRSVRGLDIMQCGGGSNVINARQQIVSWMLKLMDFLRLQLSTAEHAISLLDRFLSTARGSDVGKTDDIYLSAIACIWMAAKFENSHAIDLCCFQALTGITFNEQSVRQMEVMILQSLGWCAMAITVSDFLATIIDHFPDMGVPPHLLQLLLRRANEILLILLPEVEFVVYQPSVISMCLIQCILDEHVPLQAVSHMDSLRKTLNIDMVAMQECYQILMDLVVDPLLFYNTHSPDHVAEITTPLACKPWNRG